ncbi:MAG: hypothetical protein L0338_35090 [Acidobacteria bacterium]|nr:hypothetical protein [Acidobacteriota bacterium]
MLIVALLTPALISAQAGSIEYQGRILAHLQHVPNSDKNKRIGIAAWAILPNVVRSDPFRALVLGGLLFKSEKRWIEFMAGGLMTSDGTHALELNVRTLDKSLKRAEIFLETEYLFRDRKLTIFPNATTSVRIKGISLKVGIEADLAFAPKGNVFIVGPRVALPLPICRRVCKSAFLTTAYRFPTEGRKTLRQYLVLNF